MLGSQRNAAPSSPADVQLTHLAAGGRVTHPTARRPIADGVLPAPLARPHFPLRYDDFDPIPDSPYGHLIHATARRFDLNPELVRAIVLCESSFDPDAISVQGARGLLQLMPETAQRFGVAPEDLADPERNLEAGVRYLSWLTRRFDGDLDSVLAAFNSGEGTVDRFQGVPPYRETRTYLTRVYRELGLDRPVT
ncbi:MAG: lytic transglycosylase domain-containing protein [Acidobacteriota bacterium]|nr:lytic transglycosylase domain-containing protein [Acidobacteriota bacterium]